MTMRLFEAIMDANHRALAGDARAGIHPADFADSLPVAALTCIDARLNAFFPDVLGLPKEQFIWLRNAGNIIFGPLSTMMRSLALSCAVKGAKEIAIIGHTDCLVCKATTMKLTEALKALGVDRSKLPDDLTEFFGLFASERQNVMKAVGFTRVSPLIGSKIPVHGLMVDIGTGKLEWVVNGYETMQTASLLKHEGAHLVEEGLDALKSLAAFKIGEMKFPDTKIGEIATGAKDWLAKEIQQAEIKLPSAPPAPAPLAPPAARKVPYPPRLKRR
jgi:carbonic anhydrase